MLCVRRKFQYYIKKKNIFDQICFQKNDCLFTIESVCSVELFDSSWARSSCVMIASNGGTFGDHGIPYGLRDTHAILRTSKET